MGLHHAYHHLAGATSISAITAGPCEVPVPVWSCTPHCVHNAGSYSLRSLDVQLIGLERMELAKPARNEVMLGPGPHPLGSLF